MRYCLLVWSENGEWLDYVSQNGWIPPPPPPPGIWKTKKPGSFRIKWQFYYPASIFKSNHTSIKNYDLKCQNYWRWWKNSNDLTLFIESLQPKGEQGVSAVQELPKHLQLPPLLTKGLTKLRKKILTFHHPLDIPLKLSWPVCLLCFVLQLVLLPKLQRCQFNNLKKKLNP